MFRNYLAAALRNLVRDRLYAAINIVGLAVGLAAAFLIALYVREEITYDAWVPDHEQVYRISTKISTNAGYVEDQSGIPTEAIAWLKLEIPSVTTASRLRHMGTSLRVGDTEYDQMIAWADPEFFSIVKPSVIAGDLEGALQAPGNAVISRRIARKYFGTDVPIGATFHLPGQYPLQVVAVTEDLPANTAFTFDIVTSTRASYSPTAGDDALPHDQFRGFNWIPGYVRLQPGADVAQAEQALREALKRHYPAEIAGIRVELAFRLVPLAKMHLDPVVGSGNMTAVKALTAVGILIAVVALINFINLMTARSARRAVEVGVRKVAGAHRRNLITQFIGEALLYVAFGVALAVGLAWLVLPEFNAFVGRAIRIDLLGQPELLAALTAITVISGVIAGAYPAFVLSAFPPYATLRSNQSMPTSARIRQGLVICQFAILVALSLAAVIVYVQTRFGMNEHLRLRQDQIVMVRTSCPQDFKDAVLEIPGVRAAACASDAMMGDIDGTAAVLPNGRKVVMTRGAVDFGLLELYGLRPLSGRFFSQDMSTDAAIGKTGPLMPLVINETLVRALGYGSPHEAVGQTVNWINLIDRDGLEPRPSTIIGVVPDFATRSVANRIDSAAFFVDRRQAEALHIKIDGNRMPETLDAIDHAWMRVGNAKPPRRWFFDQHVQSMYRDIERQGILLAVFAAVTVFVAGLGLFGLSTFVAERRTKEIGIRKSMGATRSDILRLLVWEFCKPVLWANVIAWPVAYFVMQRWLEGFAYHIDLQPWMFLAASGLALGIAVMTVIGHALMVARAKPVAALRYE